MGGFKKSVKEALPEIAIGLATTALTSILTSKTLRSLIKEKILGIVSEKEVFSDMDYPERRQPARAYSEIVSGKRA
ncbi:MAG: hypothetical protein HQK75_16135 [Candidatus Magnetomorum sp.]|nr:hypothetical protein [Candidatus Magnetomorum sp.]